MGRRIGAATGAPARVAGVAIAVLLIAWAGIGRGQPLDASAPTAAASEADAADPTDPEAAVLVAANPGNEEADAGDDDDSAEAPAPAPSTILDGDETPEQLRTQISTLEALLAGKAPPETEPRELFRVDPRDAKAAAARGEQLRKAIEKRTAERDGLVSRTEAGDDDDSAQDDDDSARSVGEAGAAALTPEQAERRTLLDLLIQRDRLRLTFLGLPADERNGILDGLEERQALDTERAAAEASKKGAEEAARRAEEARRAAEEEAAQARSRSLKELAEERAHAEESRFTIASQRSEQADERFNRAEVHADRQDWARRAEARLASGDLSESEAYTLYLEAVDLLALARDDLRAALADLGAAPGYAEYDPTLDPHLGVYLEHPLERAELMQVLEAVDRERDEALTEEKQWRWERVDQMAPLVLRLNDIRLDLVPYLSPTDRETVIGWGPGGFQQMGREGAHLGLMTRWYVRCRYRALADVPSWLFETLGRSSSRWTAVLLLVVLLGSIWAFRNRRDLLTRFNKWVRTEARERERERVGLRIVRWVNSLGVDLGIWIAAWLLVILTNRLTDVAEVQLLERLVLTYAAYRFLRGTVHALILSAATFTRRKVSPELSDRILRSVRLFGRYALGVAVVLVISASLVGKGSFHAKIVDLASLGWIPIVFILLRRWRDDLFDVYLPTFPRSRLNEPIQKMRTKWYAVIVVIPASLHLLGRAGYIYLRAVALRFEKIRKAVSYLFRRRLETKAAEKGHGTADLSTLPDELREAFRLEAEGDVVVGHFPGLERTLEQVERYRDDGAGTAVALVGERGVGKTAWLHELERRVDGLPVRYARIENSVITEEAACAEISRILGIEPCTDVDSLSQAARALPRQVILIDHCQEFVLRCVRGADGFEAAAQVLQRTVGHLVWVCAFSKPIWEYLEFVHRGQNVFENVQYLRGWSETEILDLVARRTAVAGYIVTFEDLIDEDVHELERDAELTRTQERFIRLLWDYTDGIPRLAMYFWLRSLIPDGERTLRVRLFQGPTADHLEVLQEQSRFVLNAVVSHGMLSLDEAVQVLQYSRDQCLSTLELLTAQGYLVLDENRYRVTNHWDRAIVRYLRRKHLLYQ